MFCLMFWGLLVILLQPAEKCTKEDSKLQGTEYEQLGSDLERSGNDFANNMRKLKRTFGDDDDEYDD